MGFSNFVRSKGYRNFMSMLYGLGASVVIMGALFKIVHLPGANIMLMVGLTTEAIIFFFSAFEPPHVEPDWSLVYPELAGMYTPPADQAKKSTRKPFETTGKSATQELDDMLSKAKIGPELIESLGDGMRKISENVGKLSDVTNSAITADEFVKNVKDAGKSAVELSQSYKKVSKALDDDAATTGNFSESIKSAANSASTLAQTYQDVSGAIRNEMSATESFSSSLSKATESANKLVEKYNSSAQLLEESAKKLNLSALDNSAYNDQLQKISANLSALNSLYETQLKTSTSQIDSTKELQSSVNQFLNSMNESASNMTKYQEELNMLTQRVAALNKVYGNMLTAMNFNPAAK